MPQTSLTILMPRIADQKWSCHSCGDCCRSLVGHVTLEERKRILDQEWEEKLGIAPLVWAGRAWVLNKREDGACVFLDKGNRCRIHAEHGEQSKPVACRIFPFSVRRAGQHWQASLRFDCPSVTDNRGAALSTYRAWLNQLLGELEETGGHDDERVFLDQGLIAQSQEVEIVNKSLISWFEQEEISMGDRLLGAARLVTTLSQAKLKNVRGERLADLMDILQETIRAELSEKAGEPTSRQAGMLRQIVLAHAEHVTLAQLRSGIGGRFRQRLRQLKSAREMLAGGGMVPELPGIRGSATFSAVELVMPAKDDAPRIEDLMRRYLLARIHGRSVFGDGYYGWTVLQGMAALVLAVTAVGWLARFMAAIDGATELRFQDAARALGIIDRAATRLPALGTWTERKRIEYLLVDDGLARLVSRYRLT